MARATFFGGAAGALARLGLPGPPAWIAVAAVAVFVAGAALEVELASAALIGSKDWVVESFDWLFVLGATAVLGIVALIGCHPLAKLRLAPDDSDDVAPEFTTLAWFAMLFSAGLASGILYWATAEPVIHHQANPFLDESGTAPGSEAAVLTALRITVLHWGLHGWAFYVLVALGIGIYSHRHGRPLAFRSALFPVLGPRWVDRWPGRTADLVALFGTVCGIGTSLGLAAAGINATLSSLFGLALGTQSQIAIVLGVCALGVVSALSGVSRGIRRLSELNVWLSAGLLLAFVALGPTAYLAGLFFETTLDYALHFLPTGTWLADDADGRAWQAEWTVFYWGWWLAWTPFVSLFIARISKGRTIREFVVSVMGVPALVILIWMTVFGGTALHQELADPGSVSVAVGQDYSLGIATVIGNLAEPGLATVLMAVAAFLLFTWMITSLDSATLVICHLLGADEIAPAKIFWGGALAAVSCALMLVGGVPALQAASIVIGLPLVIIVLLVGVGILRDLVRGRI